MYLFFHILYIERKFHEYPLQAEKRKTDPMAEKILSSNLLALQNSLTKYYPGSLRLYGQVCSILSGRWKGYEFWVDKWPDYTAVISCENRVYQTKYDDNINVYSIFASETSGLERLLYRPDIVNWKKDISFAGVSSEIWETIKKASRDHDGQVEEPIVEARTVICEEKDLFTQEIPNEVIVESVTEDMSGMVFESRGHSGTGNEDFIKNIIQNFTSVCLRTSSGEVIGYELVYPYWSVGFLYVMPNFRRKGYGKLIQTLLARKLFNENKTPWGYIDISNKVSLDSHMKIGYREIPNGRVSWLQHKINSLQNGTGCCTQKRCVKLCLQ